MSYDDGTIQAAASELYDEHRSLDALLRKLSRSDDRDAHGTLLDELQKQ